MNYPAGTKVYTNNTPNGPNVQNQGDTASVSVYRRPDARFPRNIKQGTMVFADRYESVQSFNQKPMRSLYVVSAINQLARDYHAKLIKHVAKLQTLLNSTDEVHVDFARNVLYDRPLFCFENNPTPHGTEFQTHFNSHTFSGVNVHIQLGISDVFGHYGIPTAERLGLASEREAYDAFLNCNPHYWSNRFFMLGFAMTTYDATKMHQFRMSYPGDVVNEWLKDYANVQAGRVLCYYLKRAEQGDKALTKVLKRTGPLTTQEYVLQGALQYDTHTKQVVSTPTLGGFCRGPALVKELAKFLHYNNKMNPGTHQDFTSDYGVAMRGTMASNLEIIVFPTVKN